MASLSINSSMFPVTVLPPPHNEQGDALVVHNEQGEVSAPPPHSEQGEVAPAAGAPGGVGGVGGVVDVQG